MHATLASEVIVIDANVAVWAVLPTLAAPDINVMDQFGAWRRAGLQPVAPMLWLAECTSAIRAAVYSHVITSIRGRSAITDLFTLQVELISLDAPLCQAAFDWAARLNQAKAYDAFYLALADARHAEFWTADRRLANAARQAGSTSAHWIGES